MEFDTGTDGDIAAQHVVGGAALILVTVLVVSIAISGGGNATTDVNRTEELTSENYSTVVVVFHGGECMYCDDTRNFVNDEVSKYDSVTVQVYDAWNSQIGMQMYEKSIKSYSTGVPVVQIGDKTWFGYTELQEQDIRDKIAECADSGCGIPEKHDRSE